MEEVILLKGAMEGLEIMGENIDGVVADFNASAGLHTRE